MLTPYSPSEKLVSNCSTNSEEKKYLPFTLNMIIMSHDVEGINPSASQMAQLSIPHNTTSLIPKI